jgi:hypothetical protein
MTTWAEIRAYVRARYELETDTAHSFSLSFCYQDGSKQRIEVRRFEAFEIDWLEFRSTVCAASKLDAVEALRQNDTMACGALALDESDTVVLLYAAPLPTMDTEELELPLFVVAGHAHRLRGKLLEHDA